MSIVHAHKLYNLGAFYKPPTVNPDDVITNLSRRTFTRREKWLLSLGLEHCFLPKPSNFTLSLCMESMVNRLQNYPLAGNTNFSDLITDIKTLINNSLKLYGTSNKETLTLFKEEDLKILERLKKNKNIIICRSDKGRGVVILDREDYIAKMSLILNDYSTFEKKKLHSDPLKHNLLLEDKVNRLLKKLLNNNNISEDEYKSLYSSGSNPGIMYGLPKVHKPNTPLRPVLSSFKTHNYKLAKFLIPFIDNFSKSELSLSNSYECFNDLKEMKLEKETFIVSLDIVSLYTNVPVSEVIDITTKLVYDNDNFRNMPKEDFRNLLKLATEDSHFIFDNVYYKQIDGLAMGCPLSATLANIFLCFHERKWLDDCPPDFKPLYYKRYVDDTFIILKNENQARQFLSYMNSKHPKIKFTIETEREDQISFLDLLIKKVDDNIDISIYRKPSFTGLGINYISACYKNFKLNSFNTLYHRAYRLSSTYLNFHKEILFLNNFFSCNGFPQHIINSKLRTFLNNIFNPPTKYYGPPKMNLFIKVPFFTDDINNFFRDELNKIFYKYFPQIKANLVFFNNNKLKRYVNHKEKLPFYCCSMVVYKFECPSCQEVYIGSTKKSLFSRFHDHKGTSCRTNRVLSSPLSSSIRDHCHIQCKCNFSIENFKIIFSGSNETEIRIAESMLIKKYNPTLNHESTSYPLKLI